MSQPFILSELKSTQRLLTAITQKPVLSFLFFWTLLNLLQVSLMELTSDEGYYWFYAQQLQWGYYDHPPLVAALIKMGSALLPGELGVRFFNVVLSTGGLALFFSVLPGAYKQNKKTYLVLFSAPLLHYLTFLLFPDGPLLFFSLLFLVVYKNFLQKETTTNALVLGLALAGMAYSKYHGVLVLLFTVVANPKLLKSGYFYLSLLVAVLFFAPHLWWQYQNNFPTLQYHLSGRTGEWGFRHVGEYLSQQLVAIGPGLIFVPFVSKAKDVFERTLKVIILGTFAFFLLSSFKTFVHFHWTSVALYPLLYFAVTYYNKPTSKPLFRWLILPFVILFFLARILLMFPLIPNMHVGEDYYHGRKAWAKEIAALAGERPVFMPNNLREASLYYYYSGQPGVTLYTRPEKKSQYELWGYEDSLQGKEVLFVNRHPFPQSREAFSSTGQKIQYTVIPSFQSYYTGIEIKIVEPPQIVADTVLNVVITMINHRRHPVSFKTGDITEGPFLVSMIEKSNTVMKVDVLQPFSAPNDIRSGGQIQKKVKVPLNTLPAGEYKLYFAIRSGVLPDAIVSKRYPVQIL